MKEAAQCSIKYTKKQPGFSSWTCCWPAVRPWMNYHHPHYQCLQNTLPCAKFCSKCFTNINTTNPVRRSLNTAILQMTQLGHSTYTASNRMPSESSLLSIACPSLHFPLLNKPCCLLTFLKYIHGNYPFFSILGATIIVPFIIRTHSTALFRSQSFHFCAFCNPFSTQCSKFSGRCEHWKQNPNPSTLSAKPPDVALGPPSHHTPSSSPSHSLCSSHTDLFLIL